LLPCAVDIRVVPKQRGVFQLALQSHRWVLYQLIVGVVEA
jgi:hypothetical protein